MVPLPFSFGLFILTYRYLNVFLNKITILTQRDEFMKTDGTVFTK